MSEKVTKVDGIEDMSHKKSGKKALMVMSIIALAWYALMLTGVVAAAIKGEKDGIDGFAVLATLYAIAYSIVAWVKSDKKTTLRYLSIAGVVWFILLFLRVFMWEANDVFMALVFGILALTYAIPYTIVELKQSRKQ